MSSYLSKYKGLSFFSYEAPEPNVKGQTVSDWNRQMEAKELGAYYINGKSLYELRVEEKGTDDLQALRFKDQEDLKQFFKSYLFSNYESEEVQKSLAEKAIWHFHQKGLQHATDGCLNSREDLKVSEAKKRIDFDTETSKDGLLITEQNTYQGNIADPKAGKILVKQIANPGPDDYHAQTTTKYLVTPTGFSLLDLDVDCPNREAADIFDKRSLLEKLVVIVKKLIEDLGIGSKDKVEQKEDAPSMTQPIVFQWEDVEQASKTHTPSNPNL
ncbi:Uncharacterised protein [Legionella lansingensis]|uniref:Uncharacterized protein n=2 Tax=Legionella lansingensis TaxID=45067 RepID=A0A0W0VLC0_9GAMM|nr:hypothetical protein Llan_1614 [Legionella lansingensis]SNV43712.1 Uncharacterised protein [Legionella lansingensis]